MLQICGTAYPQQLVEIKPGLRSGGGIEVIVRIYYYTYFFVFGGVGQRCQHEACATGQRRYNNLCNSTARKSPSKGIDFRDPGGEHGDRRFLMEFESSCEASGDFRFNF